MLAVARAGAVAALVLLTLAGCASTPVAAPGTTAPATTAPATSAPATSATATTTTTVATAPGPVVVEVRLERLVEDGATDGFEDAVRAILLDPRGWQQAGFELRFVDDPDAPNRIVLAEGDVVDELCAPYTTDGEYSCQIGGTVALNADRWRFATDTWPGTLDEYRTMLVNHEVGHLLGQHHPAEFCAGPGEPAPVMAQQSTGLRDCVHNPWPLPWELACAAQGVEPIAPPHEDDPPLTCGP